MMPENILDVTHAENTQFTNCKIKYLLAENKLMTLQLGSVTNLIDKYKPYDSTTNPTLILQASEKPEFQGLIKKSIEFGIKNFFTYVTKGRKKKEIKPVVLAQL